MMTCRGIAVYGLDLFISSNSSRFECWFKFSSGGYRHLTGNLHTLTEVLKKYLSEDKGGKWERFRHMDQVEGHYIRVEPCRDLEVIHGLIKHVNRR